MTKDTEQKPWHALPPDEVVQELSSDPEQGLSHDEAARRLDEYGPNRVDAKAGQSALVLFLLQFHQPLIYILIAAGVVTILLAEYIDAAVILGVVVLNAIIGYIQESRALSALAALSRTLATTATVIREGERHSIAAAELVPGDIIVAQSGDKIPADLRLLRVRDLNVDEAPFTGESVHVAKDEAPVTEDAEFGDRKSMAYSSTLVSAGQATGIVVATGQDTELGRISELIESTEDIATPLTRRIAWFSRVLVVAIVALAIVTFFIGLAHGEPPSGVFLASVALAVAAIPEGLPAVITITLAIGVSRMARRRAIVRKLPAVETLGSTTVICSDKTGTLTENQMTVQRIWAGGHSYSVSGVGYQPEGHVEPAEHAPGSSVALDRSLLAGLLCNDSAVRQDHESDRWEVRGDPTEGALIVAANKAGLFTDECEREYPRVDAIPFESEHQFMATLHDGDDGRAVFLKGSAEAILRRCSGAIGPDGEPTELDHDAVTDAVHAMAEHGLRVLAFAQMTGGAPSQRITHDDVKEGLSFLGLQGMIDPPRDEVIDAVARCQKAGITVKMITGDHAVTAAAIAREIGIGRVAGGGPDDLPKAITGRELERLGDGELYEAAQDVDVFARVPPEGKLRLVRALQRRGHIVAMTGDGVNDGAALSQADIGIAMGITGTEVARDASDVVLTDDNFASIAAAVEEGRGVFDNLTKFVVFTLPTNLGQALAILVPILLGTTLPMLPVHVLWVNMVTAVLLGLMLAFEPKERGIMERPPRDPKAQLLTGAMVLRMFTVSVIMLVGAYALFHWTENRGGSIDEARTVVVNVFIFIQVFYLVNCRSMAQSLYAIGPFSNMWIVYGIAAVVVTQLAFTYAPLLNTLFNTEPISLEAWAFIIAIGLFTYFLIEGEKILRLAIGRPITHSSRDLRTGES